MTDANTATVAATEVAPAPAQGGGEEARSLWSDAWRQLRRNPLFWISAALILIFLLMAFIPQLFTRIDPTSGSLRHVRESMSGNLCRCAAYAGITEAVLDATRVMTAREDAA